MGRDEILAAPPAERKRLRAEALAAVAPFADTARGRSVTITDGPRMDGTAVVLSVQVMRGGVDVTPPTLNPIRLVNPPTLVGDAAGAVSVTRMEADAPGQPEQPVERRYREDPAAVLRSILRDLVP